MSSVRGGGARGRGRGSTPQPHAPARGSSTRGRVFGSHAPRGNPIKRGTFGAASQAPATRGMRQLDRGNGRRTALHSGAFGAAKTGGSWQDRYQALTKARERERTEAIRHGVIADPDKPRSLSEAITPVGTCQDMCAEYERVQRVVQKDVWEEETDPTHSAFASTDKEPDEARMVKKFRRAAAGLEEQLPSDLRPPHILKRTCDYLFNEVVGNAPFLGQVHHFVWDRTRAVRNDFSIQQVTRPEELSIAIDCYERIARFHIVSLHQLALPEKPYSKYDWQQEREQLDRTLLSLMQFYDDSHGRIDLPNEPEFRAYCVIFQLQDPTPDLEDRVQTWPRRIVEDTRVHKALDLYMAACNVIYSQGPLKPTAHHLIARQDWQRFWTLVASKQVSYLMACVAEIYFNLVRRMVLSALFRTFRMNSNLATPDWTIDILCDLLGFDDGDEVYTYCERFGFGFNEREDGEHYLDLTSVKGRTLPEPSAGMPKQTKSALVEDKRFGRTLPAVINGLTVQGARNFGLVEEQETNNNEQDMMTDEIHEQGVQAEALNGSDAWDGDSLFIPETKTPDAQHVNPFSAKPTVTSNPTSSIFSGAAAGTTTFGKPSAFAEQPSIFAQPAKQSIESPAPIKPANAQALFDFKEPAKTSTGPNFSFSSPFTTSPFSKGTGVTKDEESAPKQFSFGQPSGTQASVFDQARPSAQSPFSFSPGSAAKAPAVAQPNDKQDASQSWSFPNKTSKDNESPRAQFTFGQTTASPAPATPSFSLQPQETKPSQPHQLTSPSTSPTSSTPPQPATASSLGLGLRRPSSAADTRPKKPSPLSASITASEQIVPTSSEAPTTQKAPARHETTPGAAIKPNEHVPETNAAEDFESLVTRLADELTHNAHDGYMKQFVDFIVSKTIHEVLDEIKTEQANAEADDWRQFHLCQKYGIRWRDIFWQRRLAKTGQQRRARRQRRLQQREDQANDDGRLRDSQSINGSHRAELVMQRGGEDHNSVRAMGSVLSVRSPGVRARAADQQHPTKRNMRPTSSHVGVASPIRELGHKRLKSTSHVDEKGRITKPTSVPVPHHHADLLKRSSFLGFSLSDDADVNARSTVRSNYFRLKAMGVTQADQLSGLRGTKRPSTETVQHQQTSPPALRPSSRLSPATTPSMRGALMAPPLSSASQAPKAHEADEALFARLRAAREGLQNGGALFKFTLDYPAQLHSSVNSISSNDSPSMIQARADARRRASLAASDNSDNAHGRSVPAYRLRESKFVPRERYADAIERAKEIRESRSRETSRPESRAQEPSFPTQSETLFQQRPVSKNPAINWSSSPAPMVNTTDSITQSYTLDHDTAGLRSNMKPANLQSHTPFTFSNHTTQLPAENPFLHSTVPESHYTFGSQPTAGLKQEHSPTTGPQDHTIKLSQVDASLANSFGSSRGLDHHNPFQAAPQQNSYLLSQAVSLLSDDEDNAGSMPDQLGTQYSGVAYTDPVNGELLDDDDDEEEDEDEETALQDLQNQEGYSEEDEDVDSSQEGSDEQFNGFGHANNFARDEAGEDGDVDEDGSSEVDEEDDEEEDGGAYGYYEDEEDEDEDVDSALYGGQWQPQVNGNARWTAQPEKPSALQNVGNSAEEAIELSD